MGFLDSEPVLDNTRFTEQDLQFARGYWKFIIENVKPDWIDDPEGAVAIHWRSDTIPSTVRLMHLAQAIWSVANTITRSSHPKLSAKLHSFLHADGRQFEEERLELLVGAELCALGYPVEIEPPSEEQVENGKEPRSVDFAVLSKYGEIFVEVTTLYCQRLLDWEAAVQGLKARFEKEMLRHECVRQLHISAPLELTNRTLEASTVKNLVREIRKSKRGRKEVILETEPLILKWMPIPHLAKSPEEPDFVPPSESFAFTSGNAKIITGAASNVRLRWPGEAEEIVLRSLRNTLDAKRAQFQLAGPYVLVIQRGNTQIPRDGLIDLLLRRIFPNNHYDWLSGVTLADIGFSQTRGFRRKYTLLQNPKATFPLPDDVVSLLLGE